jgi:hypothetical protein
MLRVAYNQVNLIERNSLYVEQVLVTAFFGSAEACGDKPNRVDAPAGWNFLMRIYRPGPSVLDGTCKLPAAELVV